MLSLKMGPYQIENIYKKFPRCSALSIISFINDIYKNKLRHAAKWPMDVTNGTNRPTDRQTDGLQELLEWPLATKKKNAEL